jgi:hypothetical protein
MRGVQKCINCGEDVLEMRNLEKEKLLSKHHMLHGGMWQRCGACQ